MRSLDASDWHLLRFRAHGLRDREWIAWVVASSIWMADGIVYMGEEEALRMLVEMCRRLPTTVLDDLYGILDGLMRRMRRATEIIEAFLYEAESRQLWRSEGNAVLARVGSPGLLRSHNPVLQLWIFFNQMEDAREHDDYLWSLAKFVAGPHVPKGVKKLNAKDKQRETDLRNRRQGVMDRAYYETRGVIPRRERDANGKKSRRRFQEVHMAESPEELREEMRRWVLGVKDDHDRVVDGVKARIKHEVEMHRREDAERRIALQRAMEEEGMTRTGLVPLVGEAGREFIERMKARVPGLSRVHDEKGHNSAYEKYIANNPEAGELRVAEDGRIISERPVDPRLLEMMRAPGTGEETPLQRLVEKRRPVAVIEEDEER